MTDVEGLWVDQLLMLAQFIFKVRFHLVFIVHDVFISVKLSVEVSASQKQKGPVDTESAKLLIKDT